MNEKEYDYIVIGAGIGGITASIILSKYYKKKVLLIEQSDKIGGYIQAFKREGYVFNTGVTYVGNMCQNATEYKIMKYITNNKIRWESSPENYDIVNFPNETVFFSKNNIITSKKKTIEKERKNIEKYYQKSNLENKYLQTLISSKLNAKKKTISDNIKGGKTTNEFLNQFIKNKEVASLLTSRWPFVGLSPDKQSYLCQIGIDNLFRNGGFYPKGGGLKLINVLKEELLKNGCELLLNCEVEKINESNNSITSIEVLDKKKHCVKKLQVKKIISNIGFLETYQKITNKNKRLKEEMDLIKKIGFTNSEFKLYIMLSDNPMKYGACASNHWFFNKDIFKNNYADIENHKENIIGMFIAFPSLKEKKNHKHTIEISCKGDYSTMLEIYKKPKLYSLIKKNITENLLNKLEEEFPGMKNIIKSHFLATPITYYKYVKHEKGNTYGIKSNLLKLKYDENFYFKNHIFDNLYMCGADTLGPGITTCMISGIGAACVSQGKGEFDKIMKNEISKNGRKRI